MSVVDAWWDSLSLMTLICWWWLMMVIFAIKVNVDNLLLPPQNSLMAALSRWVLTNHVLFTCHLWSAIFLCKRFPYRCKGWVDFVFCQKKSFLHIALKMISSQCISLFAPHRNWGYQKSFHTGTIWSSPGLLSLPELTKSWGADYTEIANDDQYDQSGCNDAITIANDCQDGDDNADDINIKILLAGWQR